MVRAAWTLMLLSTSLAGQATVKDKAADYPAHAVGQAVAIGAEYLVHSIPAGNQTLFARDYLVVEVAVFPAKAETIDIGSGTFSLRLNGRQQMLTADAPGFVAASLKYPDWEQHPTAEAQVGVGDTGVIIGRPATVGRFPDDPSQSRMPRTSKAPESDEERPEPPEQIIARTALPEGPASKPVSGYLYFHFRGKMKSIKSLELVYQGKAETVSLKLM